MLAEMCEEIQAVEMGQQASSSMSSSSNVHLGYRSPSDSHID